eukprot:g20080.t1
MLSISEKTYADSGHAIRSVHAKSHGLLSATVEVLEGLPPELAQGIFAEPGRYEAVIRLSTTPGDILHDSVSTPRGMALKILDVEGERLPGSEGSRSQDFVMVNGKEFNSPSGKAFLKNLKLLAATTDRMEGTKELLSKAFRGVEAALEAVGRESAALKSMGGSPVTHILGESFFGQLPIRYGDHIAKVAVVPASDNLKALTGKTFDTKDPDVIRHETEKFFEDETAVWNLQVQLCTDLQTMPVESVEAWDEEKSPFITVARITALPQTAWSEERAEAVDDGMHFSPWNGLAAHQPLGQIMRLRKLAYHRSAGFRLALDPAPKIITFDCYGTLVRWHEVLLDEIGRTVAELGAEGADASSILDGFSSESRRLTAETPHRPYKDILRHGFATTFREHGLSPHAEQIERIARSPTKMGPHPEVPDALRRLRNRYRLAIFTNSDDDLIAPTVANIGVPFDYVITAEQAQAYKPSRQIFDHAYRVMGVAPEETVHVAMGMYTDMKARHELGLRAIWVNRGGETGNPDWLPYAEENPMKQRASKPQQPFFGWYVVAATFVLAMFGWGVGFYGPPVFLYAVVAQTGWPVALVSAAVTMHFLVGAIVVANLPKLYRKFGVPRVTVMGAALLAAGIVGWASAQQYWQLALAALATGTGWVALGAAAVNALIAPWFVQRRPAALGMAYNGASLGGAIFSPLWILLINDIGFGAAAILVGVLMILIAAVLSIWVFSKTPEQLGQTPDGHHRLFPNSRAAPNVAPVHGSLWQNRRFLTLTAGMMLGLFAQIGLLAHLFSLLAPVLGERTTGFLMGGATLAAIAGRSAVGWFMPVSADRRLVACLSYGVQFLGSLLLSASAHSGSSICLILGIGLFGLGIGNATSLPPLIAQKEFSPEDAARVVPLIVAIGQAGYAFAPAAFGLLRPDAADAYARGGDGTALFVVAALVQAAAISCLLAGRRGSRETSTATATVTANASD